MRAPPTTGAKEKDINLGVALQRESIIKKKMKSAQVVMTRKNDSYLTLQERADKANKAKGDFFLYLFTQNSVDKSNKTERQYQVVLSSALRIA